ncbi:MULTISPECIES: DegV family protein [unclassified Mesobacillus]|uniref:DegV family protein n=1 Tax=unclassified Mesobacillus TaxID=2675270 RepID=UPI00203C4762|nr:MULTISPECIES: DegV family protein [unclassified Mesobacillus]MCM3122106.1 DegV family protein [Mesobacillus sp. MER 33]MCM3232070.1 DegV family protein [Mesobacillus sp. MER 48]
MKKIAWVTDSTAYLDEELKNNPDVYQVPMTIVLDDVEYLDGKDLTAEELYEKLKEVKTPPKTSQPPVGVFMELYEKLEKEYDLVFAVLISSKLSGTVASSVQAAQAVNIPVITFDSKILTYPLTSLLKKGIYLAEQGATVEEIKEKLEIIRDSNETYVMIGNLEQLHRSGRMSGVQFYLGSMLSIKPIISIEDGGLNTKEKVRSDKKARDIIFEYLKVSQEKYGVEEVYILYGLHKEAADEWQSQLEGIFPGIQFLSCPIGAVIGVHAGEHTIGISWNNAKV